jgi:flavorubredoxin
MYSDLINRDFWPDYKYYFDIIFRPFKKHVRNALKKIDELQIEMIAPSTGRFCAPILLNSSTATAAGQRRSLSTIQSDC